MIESARTPAPKATFSLGYKIHIASHRFSIASICSNRNQFSTNNIKSNDAQPPLGVDTRHTFDNVHHWSTKFSIRFYIIWLARSRKLCLSTLNRELPSPYVVRTRMHHLSVIKSGIDWATYIQRIADSSKRNISALDTTAIPCSHNKHYTIYWLYALALFLPTLWTFIDEDACLIVVIMFYYSFNRSVPVNRPFKKHTFFTADKWLNMFSHRLRVL